MTKETKYLQVGASFVTFVSFVLSRGEAVNQAARWWSVWGMAG